MNKSIYPEKPAFYIKTFWCQMNYADSEKIHRILLQSGCIKVLDPTKADIIIINTCSVRQKGEDKVFWFIREIRKASKESGRAVIIGITGCMVRKTGIAKRYLESAERDQVYDITLVGAEGNVWNWDDPLLLRSEDIDFVFRIEETGHVSKLLSTIMGREFGNDEKWEEYLRISQIPSGVSSANIIIQTGCDNFCTYCIVPYTRWRELSRPIVEITEEAREAAANGAKEITLLGQNVNSYGKMTKRKLWNSDSLTWNTIGSTWVRIMEEATPFRELLNSLAEIPELDRIRFTSSNPHDMTLDILDAHFELPKLCNSLHFALQSGSNTVLKRMNRKHTYEDFLSQVRYLRSKDPLFSISTDIIVGFPGETEEEFQATVQAMKECEFDFAYIARYSERNWTHAAKFTDDVSPTEKARRWSILNDLLQKNIEKRAKLMIWRTEEILVTGKGRLGNWVGRTRNFKEVYFDTPEDTTGKIVPVRIISLNDWVFKGEPL